VSAVIRFALTPPPSLPHLPSSPPRHQSNKMKVSTLCVAAALACSCVTASFRFDRARTLVDVELSFDQFVQQTDPGRSAFDRADFEQINANRYARRLDTMHWVTDHCMVHCALRPTAVRPPRPIALSISIITLGHRSTPTTTYISTQQHPRSPRAPHPLKLSRGKGCPRLLSLRLTPPWPRAFNKTDCCAGCRSGHPRTTLRCSRRAT
jgi:hypothetical protein